MLALSTSGILTAQLRLPDDVQTYIRWYVNECCVREEREQLELFERHELVCAPLSVERRPWREVTSGRVYYDGLLGCLCTVHLPLLDSHGLRPYRCYRMATYIMSESGDCVMHNSVDQVDSFDTMRVPEHTGSRIIATLTLRDTHFGRRGTPSADLW